MNEQAQQQLAAIRERRAKMPAGDYTKREARAENKCDLELKADNNRLREEVSRLSQPVEDERSFWASDANGTPCEVFSAHHFRAERNAREAAERERDELREFCKTRIVPYDIAYNGFYATTRARDMDDAKLNELLAAYRAEKGKVAT